MAHMPLPTSSPLKSPDAFRTISEVADDIGVAQHVLRFWETKFTQVKPLKRGGGRRYYRPEDVALLKRIHSLLYSEGYTIPGAQKVLRGLSKAQIVEQLQQAAKAARPPIPSQSISGQNMAPESVLPAVHKAAANQVTQPTSGFSGKQKAQLQAVLGDLLEMRQILKTKKA